MRALKKELVLRIYEKIYRLLGQRPIYRIVRINSYHYRSSLQIKILKQACLGRDDNTEWIREECVTLQMRNPIWRFIDSWVSVAPFLDEKSAVKFVTRDLISPRENYVSLPVDRRLDGFIVTGDRFTDSLEFEQEAVEIDGLTYTVFTMRHAERES